MNSTNHETHNYPLVGGDHVAEKPGTEFAAEKARLASIGKCALLLLVLMFGATTTAAIATTSRGTAAPSVSGSNFQLKIPGAGWFEPTVY
jgi:hypothetical protein